MISVTERMNGLRAEERSLTRQLTGPSRGLDRPALSKKLASVRRQMAMMAEADRQPMAAPEQSKRFA